MFTDRLKTLIDEQCNGKQSVLAQKSGLPKTVSGQPWKSKKRPRPATKLLAVVFHCYVDVVLRDAKRFYVPDADKQRKKFDKIISHETHLL